MKQLKDITASLETSKRMKELGFPQEGLFGWYEIWSLRKTGKKMMLGKDELETYFTEKTELHRYSKYYHNDSGKYRNYITAPTAEEILDVLPLYLKIHADKGISFTIETKGLQMWKNYNNTGYVVAYGEYSKSGKTLVEALGKMYYFLKEQELI